MVMESVLYQDGAVIGPGFTFDSHAVTLRRRSDSVIERSVPKTAYYSDTFSLRCSGTYINDSQKQVLN